MTADQALLRLGASSADAVQRVLSGLSPVPVAPGEVAVVPPERSPFADVDFPAIAVEVSYVDGVSGGNVLVVGVEGARRLAAASMGGDPLAVASEGDLTEPELAALGELCNTVVAEAAAATREILQQNVETAPPDVRSLASFAEAGERWEHPGHATVIRFAFCGEPCVLVALVPNAFVVRMTRALDEMTQEYGEAGAPLTDALRHVEVRVWAELGRTRMASGRVVGLPGGAVVELDREVDDPIDLYVDGMPFATARLLVTDDGALAVRIEQVLGGQPDVDPDPRAEIAA